MTKMPLRCFRDLVGKHKLNGGDMISLVLRELSWFAVTVQSGFVEFLFVITPLEILIKKNNNSVGNQYGLFLEILIEGRSLKL